VYGRTVSCCRIITVGAAGAATGWAALKVGTGAAETKVAGTGAPVGKDLKSISAGTQDTGRPEATEVEQVAAPRFATGVCKVACPGGEDVTAGAANATGAAGTVDAAGAAVAAKIGGSVPCIVAASGDTACATDAAGTQRVYGITGAGAAGGGTAGATCTACVVAAYDVTGGGAVASGTVGGDAANGGQTGGSICCCCGSCTTRVIPAGT